jgi:hypothetical protein
MTTGKPRRRAAAAASALLATISASAVGNPWRRQNCLAKTLLDSSSAARWLGQAKPALGELVADAQASGSSGPPR